METLHSKVLVIAHDAGGAEVISAYIKKHADKEEFHVYVAGPAARVFRRNRIPFKRAPSEKERIVRLVKKYSDAKFVLLGTGWMTTIEFDALIAANELGLKTVCYLESWVNFRERFGYPSRGWKKNLPDEIWVGDKYALVLAKHYFFQTHVRFVPNQYFANAVSEYRRLSGVSIPQYDILFLSDTVPGMESIFEELLVEIKKKKTGFRIRLGFHPADNRHRYDELIARFSGDVKIDKSREKSLVRDLLRVRAVIGTETVAMVISALVGKKTISVRLTKNKRMLPFTEIVYVSNARSALRLI